MSRPDPEAGEPADPEADEPARLRRWQSGRPAWQADPKVCEARRPALAGPLKQDAWPAQGVHKFLAVSASIFLTPCFPWSAGLRPGYRRVTAASRSGRTAGARTP